MAKYIGEQALAELVTKMKAYADNAGIVEITSSTNLWSLEDGVYTGTATNFVLQTSPLVTLNSDLGKPIVMVSSNALNQGTKFFFAVGGKNPYNKYSYGSASSGAYSSATLDIGNILTMGDVLDTLTSTSTTLPLSANQGKVLKGLVDGKQDTLTFDTAPTASSTNPVTSGGIYTTLTGNGISSIANKGLSTNDFDATYKGKLDGIASGAQVNVIEGVKSGSTTFTPTSKVVDIQGVNNLTNYYTKTEIDATISSVYKPAGSVTFANLPTLSASVLGNVYNVSNAFTTTSDFVEGAGNDYPAGTNVVVVDISSTSTPNYKFDVLAGFVDLSDYLTNEDITNTSNVFSVSKASDDSGETLTSSLRITPDATYITYEEENDLAGWYISGELADAHFPELRIGVDGIAEQDPETGDVYGGTSLTLTPDGISYWDYTDEDGEKFLINGNPVATRTWTNTQLSGKQNTLTFDSTPTSASTNPVTSGGVYTALSGKQDTMTELTAAEVDTIFDNN